MIKWFPFQYKYRLSRYRDAKLIVSCECACALKSYKRVKFLRQSATSSSCCPLWKSPSSVLSSWVCPLIPGYVFLSSFLSICNNHSLKFLNCISRCCRSICTILRMQESGYCQDLFIIVLESLDWPFLFTGRNFSDNMIAETCRWFNISWLFQKWFTLVGLILLILSFLKIVRTIIFTASHRR